MFRNFCYYLHTQYFVHFYLYILLLYMGSSWAYRVWNTNWKNDHSLLICKHFQTKKANGNFSFQKCCRHGFDSKCLHIIKHFCRRTVICLFLIQLSWNFAWWHVHCIGHTDILLLQSTILLDSEHKHCQTFYKARHQKQELESFKSVYWFVLAVAGNWPRIHFCRQFGRTLGWPDALLRNSTQSSEICNPLCVYQLVS